MRNFLFLGYSGAREVIEKAFEVAIPSNFSGRFVNDDRVFYCVDIGANGGLFEVNSGACAVWLEGLDKYELKERQYLFAQSSLRTFERLFLTIEKGGGYVCN